MSEPDISKLPKWAREHISKLQRERDTAVRALNESLDCETKSPFFVSNHESTGEACGASKKVKFIQTGRVDVLWKGVLLRISTEDGRCPSIQLQWDSVNNWDDVAMIPHSHNYVCLVSKENMR